ncbi:DEAD/DEAH box helicase [Hydrogenovibrio sp. 3SP14C1]|uniref:DEAD/DEAH box helicase n=1 Tax=Hydrogenovibrio sp. 3SP14C1 TaxID=3038774 RepID=UPI002416F8FB|nr:DEAD/DEAH box helicase [Hydrogenovibrio sp. 3SP14C1]MDG4812475.1 DEAD/DEAH box helicase [Hydrogenovibrio sp. 3SP14C1]
MPFSNLGLSAPIVKAVSELGYEAPTDIQKQAIPIILSGKDLMAAAQTGTGKTASFVLPLLEKLNTDDPVRGRSIRALILAPTRELAMQVETNVVDYAKHLNLSSMAVYGGTDIDTQKQRLMQGIDILVATPGRLLDLAYQRALFFDDLEFLVLDEADKMLDMGFIDDLYKITDRLPHQRQSLLFSATLTETVRYLAADTVSDDAAEIAISPQNKTTPKIKQWLITVDKDTKSTLLSHLINEQHWDQALIFVEKKHSAAKLVEQLGKRGIIADSIHSGRSQAAREQVLSEFKSGKLKFLIATGIAARGIDIDNLSRVVNYDLPYPAEEYIHRIGRTGRAGAAGEAISLVSKDDFKNLCAIESLLDHLIERKEIEGFPVKKVVPISILNYQRKQK